MSFAVSDMSRCNRMCVVVNINKQTRKNAVILARKKETLTKEVLMISARERVWRYAETPLPLASEFDHRAGDFTLHRAHHHSRDGACST